MIKKLLILLAMSFSSVAYSNIPPSPQERPYLLPNVGTNILSNPSFERGLIGVTASTTGIATTTTNAVDGNYGLQIDTSGAQSVQIGKSSSGRLGYNTNFFSGRSCIATINYRVPSTPSSTITISVKKVSDDSNLASSTTLGSTGSNWSKVSIPFLCDTSSAAYINIATSGAEIAFYVDQAYVGTTPLAEVSQSIFAGESYFAGTTNCTGWTRTSTTVGALSTDADCPGPTIVRSAIGDWQTTDADLPIQTINNLPSGTYLATFYISQTMGANNASALAINDGTTTCEPSPGQSITTNFSTGVVSCSFEYSTPGNRSFQLYVASNANTVTVDNSITTPRISTRFSLVRYPTSAQKAYLPDQTPASWSGYHDTTCSFSRTNVAYGDFSADATCAFTEKTNRNFGTVTSYLSGSDKLPGIVFTPPRIGSYFVCAIPKFYSNTNNATASVRLTDGTTVVGDAAITNTSGTNSLVATSPICSIYVATNISSKTLKIEGLATSGDITILAGSSNAIEWSIFELDAPMPTPFLDSALTAINTLSFTPVSFGTVSNTVYTSQLVGDVLHVKGVFTVGTSVAAIARIDLPSGYTLKTDQYGSGQFIVGKIWRSVTGFAGTSGGPFPIFYDGSDTDSLFYASTATSNALDKALGNTNFGSGNVAWFDFEIIVNSP